jgi:hypothetical protein
VLLFAVEDALGDVRRRLDGTCTAAGVDELRPTVVVLEAATQSKATRTAQLSVVLVAAKVRRGNW